MLPHGSGARTCRKVAICGHTCYLRRMSSLASPMFPAIKVTSAEIHAAIDQARVLMMLVGPQAAEPFEKAISIIESLLVPGARFVVLADRGETVTTPRGIAFPNATFVSRVDIAE